MDGGYGRGNGRANGRGNGYGNGRVYVDGYNGDDYVMDMDPDWDRVEAPPPLSSSAAFDELLPQDSRDADPESADLHRHHSHSISSSNSNNNVIPSSASAFDPLFLLPSSSPSPVAPSQYHQQPPVSHFHLLQITSDKQDLSFVDKVLVSEKEISALCVLLAPGSSRVNEHAKITAIDFSLLDAKEVNVIGFYGDKAVMSRVFSEKGYAPAQVVQAMSVNSLNPGLYACLHSNVKKMYLFYWDGRADMVAASRKDVSCNFVRYLMELCEVVYVCVQGKSIKTSLPTQSSSVAAGSPGVRRAMRTQRLQISMKKESEDDLKIRKGFHVPVPADLAHGAVGFMIAEGLHRTAVLAATITTPKVITRRVSDSKTADQIKRWIHLKIGDGLALDTSRLSTPDFILFLKTMDETELLDKYEAQQKLWRAKLSEVKSRSVVSLSSKKEDEILRVVDEALDAYLILKYPWEEKIIKSVVGVGNQELPTAERTAVVEDHTAALDAEQTLHAALAKLESDVCAIFAASNNVINDAKLQRFLFSGSELVTENASNPSKPVFSIATEDGSVGPICYNQEITFTHIRSGTGDEETDVVGGEICRGKIVRAYCSPTKQPKLEPVIVDAMDRNAKLLVFLYKDKGDTTRPMLIRRHASETAKVQWLEDMCVMSSVPSLFKMACAASYLVGKSSLLPDEKIEELMKMKSVKEWTKHLSPEAASVLIEYVDEHSNTSTPSSVQEKIIPVVANVYKHYRGSMKQALQSCLKQNISPSIKKVVENDHDAEVRRTTDAVNAEKEMFRADLQKKFGSGGELKDNLILCLTSLEEQNSYFNKYKGYMGFEVKMKLSYSIQEVEKESVKWRAVDMVPCRDALEDMSTGSEGRAIVITPSCSKTEEFVTLDPATEELIKVVFTKCGQVLTFVRAKDMSWLHLYHCPRLGASMRGRNPLKEYKRGIDLVAVDEVSRWMVMYNRDTSNIQGYRFDNSFKSLEYTGVTVQLSKFSGSTNLVWMEFVPGRRELLLVDDDGRLRLCDLAAGMMSPKHRMLPYPLIKALVTPDASCFMAFSTSPHNRDLEKGKGDVEDEAGNGECDGTPLWAHVYLLNDSLSFLKCLPLYSIPLENSKRLQAECKFFGTQMQLVFISADSNGRASVQSHVLEVSTAQQCFQLRKVIPSKRVGSNGVNSNDPLHCEDSCGSPALDYIYHVFDKYAVSPPLCPSERDLRIIVLFDPSGDGRWDAGSATRWCDAVVSSTQQKLEEKGKHFDDARIQFSHSYLAYGLDIDSMQPMQMGKWVQRVVSLVPMQISRAENNTLKPLLNGLQIPADLIYTDAVSLAGLLRFGLYDLVIANWKGEIKVISSMGKQSSGKSYLLNHLAGCFLDVAGGRCTDGVWMTVRTEEDCLYVLLDFEGLGSFERTEQEDMLLSILNAAISNVTIFNKKDFHLDKETEAIFQRFQDGVSLVKADDKLFRGLFYMAIKDVDASDVDDLKSEFYQKISHICSKSKENFLTTMYGGEVEIAAMPPFQRREFQDSVADIGEVIQETESCYRSGQQFLEDLKLVISQISARDWAPLDSKRLILRLSVLRQHLDHAISMGQCVEGGDLLNFEEQKEIEDEPVVVGMTEFRDVKDAGLELAEAVEEGKSLAAIVVNLGEKFESVVRRQEIDEEKWHSMYEAFLGHLVERRSLRITKWLQVNTQQFEQEGDVQKLKLEATAKLAEMKSKLVICSCKCEACFLRCLLVKGHDASQRHSCLGTHRCARLCTYCEEKESGGVMVLGCNDLAGHAGAHDCKQKAHTCGKACVFASKSSNCNKSCSQRVDHEGDHRCNSLQHLCNQECSLPGCTNSCAIPHERGNHMKHQCHEKFCPSPCSMPGCKRNCAVMDHFHELELEAEHFCEQSHPCTEKCEVPGVCHVQTELLKQTRSFHGKRSQFDYEYVSEQTESRKECCISIPPSRRHHDGPHRHSTNPNVVHYCDARCPACDYYCNLPIGHPGPHKAVHGNMKNTQFVSEAEDIDVLDRKYVRGESGEAEMCMMHCKARGRGHTHLVPCPGSAGSGVGLPCTEKVYDGARHVERVGLGVNVAMDELTHEAYWKYIRFVDPCEDAEKDVFGMCDHYCRSDEHNQQGNSSRSYCTEKLWHEPVLRAGNLQTGSGGYVTEDGHHFPCNHAKDAPHNIIFVMDKSGSMASEDIRPTMSMFSSGCGHNNRLGCVFEAVLRFIQARMQGVNVGNMLARDTVSVVLFDYVAHAAVEGEDISEAVVHKLMNYYGDGGTTYSAGLEEAERMLERLGNRADVSGKSPVVIFLSDGGNNGGIDPVYIVHRMKEQDARLVVHTIMFGRDPYANILQKMARAGDGTFQLSLDEVELARSFEGLAKSLKPKLTSLVAIS